MDEIIRKRPSRPEEQDGYSPKTANKRINKKKIIRALTATVVVMSVVLIVMGAATYSSLMSILKNPGHGIINQGPKETLPNFVALPTMPPTVKVGDKEMVKNHDVVSVLFLGIDTSAERGESFGYQSDMLMLAAINVKTNHATLISIPRDTLAVIDRLDSKGNVKGQTTTKINAAFSNGGGAGKYSYINTINAVNRLLGMDVQNYVGINMDGIVAITNAVGGVPMTMDADFSSADWRMQKGASLTLTGAQAELYVRHRKLPGMDGSDISRTARQLKFVKAFANVIKSKGANTYLVQLYNQVTKYVDTNLDLGEIAGFASILNGLDLDALETVTLPGKGDSKGNWALDMDKVQEILAKAYYE